MQKKTKQMLSERIKKRSKLGFSLVELIVVIAIMAVLVAILVPTILQYVEKSRAQKDFSAMDEVTNAVKIAMADQDVYDEMLQYNVTLDDGGVPVGYAETTDEAAAAWSTETMRGATITFTPNADNRKSIVTIGDGVMNAGAPDGKGGKGTLLSAATMDDGEHNYMYGRLKDIVGEKIELSSQTYRNSAYTVFIKMGTLGSGEGVEIYGQWGGTNLPKGDNVGGSGGSGGGNIPTNIIPEGGTYYVGVISNGDGIRKTYTAERVYTAGDEFPEETLKGDAYVFGDYVYAYGFTVEDFQSNLYWSDYSYGRISAEPHWGVGVNDTGKTEYGEILNSINGLPVTEMVCTFFNCDYIINAPTIPGSVKSTHDIFAWNEGVIQGVGTTYSLKTAAFAEGVISIDNGAFSSAQGLEKVTLPSTVALIDEYAFYNCTNLTTINFNGTKDQWGSIIKGQDWNSNTGEYTVRCVDGNVCKSCTLVTNENAQWEPGSETQHRKAGVCSTCGATEYIYENHQFAADANSKWEEHQESGYSSHKRLTKCSCGQTSYEYGSHSLVIDDGAEWEYSSSSQHKIAGTCECGYKEYVYESHSFVADEGAEYEQHSDTQHKIKAHCYVCDCEGYKYSAHSGGMATCESKATCDQCGQEYGDIGSCVPSGGVCTICGKEVTVIQTAHNPHPKNQNYVVIGTWDYSDATSVDITITYQTVGTYAVWGSITEGADYVAGSSYNATRNYLNTSGSIVNAKGTTSSVKFGDSTKKTQTFSNVDMLTGSVIFKSVNYSNKYYGITVTVTPNY